jgi:uncharacterized protein
MFILVIYIITAILSHRIIWVLTNEKHSVVRIIALAMNLLLSLFFILFAIKVRLADTEYATPAAVKEAMYYNLALFTVLLPRTILALLHYSGALIRIRTRSYIKPITMTGLAVWLLILILSASGLFIGRFNFRYEEVSVPVADLHPSLEGFKIVHLSDLHLAGFHGSAGKIRKMAEMINSINADLIVNTGDFITLGAEEYGRFDTILSTMQSVYGNYAILGNHDIGTYLRDAGPVEIEYTTRSVSAMIEASGYTLLNRSNQIVDVNGARLAIIGAETKGRHPVIVHPDLDEALKGTIDADLRILLTHDPNHWDIVIRDYPGIELTLSGHTHGMQFGYIGKRVKWSPSKYFYPRWHGLFIEENMYLYVNRGLGVLGVPVRIGMPPEITVLTLTRL